MYGGLHSPGSLPSEGALEAVARRFTPRVEALSSGLVLLDLHGLARRWPTPEALGRQILAAAHEQGVVDARLALALSRTAVALLARARPGLSVVPPGGEAAALAPLPLALLGLPEEQERLLSLWGLATLGELARLPTAGLAERLGRDGPRLIELARGEDETPFVPTPPADVFEATLEMEWPVDGLEPLAFLLGRVLDTLMASLVARGRAAAALALELALEDATHHVWRLAPSAATAEPRTWRTLLLLELESRPPQAAVVGLTLRAEPTPARVVQFSLLDPAQPSPERLAETLARLREWTASGRAGSPRLLDTHRPGAFVLESFAPPPLAASPRVRPPLWPRVALRVFRPPLPAQVAVSGGAPVHVQAPGVRGAVRERAGPWRASGDWWDVAWSREEWDVALERGVYRLFLDRLRGAWFVEGELD